jgi:hypothetical protein
VSDFKFSECRQVLKSAPSDDSRGNRGPVGNRRLPNGKEGGSSSSREYSERTRGERHPDHPVGYVGLVLIGLALGVIGFPPSIPQGAKQWRAPAVERGKALMSRAS